MMKYDPHHHQTFADVYWLERWNDSTGPEVMTLPNMQSDGTWEIYTVGPLGQAHVQFKDVDKFTVKMERWLQAVREAKANIELARADLGLETK